MYADYTSLYYQALDTTQLNETINNDFTLIEQWLRGNKLSLNVMKTHSMLISPKQKHTFLKYQNEFLKLKNQGVKLEVVQKYKLSWCTS